MIRMSAPISMIFNITSRCNSNCIYCSLKERPFGPDLDDSDTLSLVQQMIRAKVFNVLITGGEPFLRPLTMQVIRELRENQVGVEINTNGTLMTDKLAQDLRELGVGRIAISLDGHTSELHDSTRGKGTFELAVNGIKLAVQNGLTVGAATVVTRRNFPHLEALTEFARSLGVTSLNLIGLSKLGRGQEAYESLGFSPGELSGMSQRIGELVAQNESFISTDINAFDIDCTSGTGKTPANIMPCGAATTFCTVWPDGTVVPCDKVNFVAGNLRVSSLMDIWNSPVMEMVRGLRQFTTDRINSCRDCPKSGECHGGCRGEALLQFDDIFGPDPDCYVRQDVGGVKNG